MKKIKRDDEVIVTTGKDKGKRGKVLKVQDDGKVIVSGINMMKKHTKPNPMLGTPGGIVEKEAPIQASNVAIFNPQTGKADRVGFQTKEDGAKVRIFKATKDAVDNQQAVVVTMLNMKEQYSKEVVPALQKEFGFKNIMQVPRIEKITLNMGVGEAVGDKKLIENAVADLERLAGQKAVVTKARKSVAGFKIREGWPIGCKVTLRGERMWDFFDRLVHIAVPRIRDFRGLNPKSFDGRGNYSMGVREQIIFPEIEYDKVDKIRGLDITITTTAGTDDEGRELLKAFGFPFKK